MPIYKVVSKLGAIDKQPIEVTKLVDAKTKAGAISHVASGIIAAEVATPAELVGLGAQGVVLEKA